MEQVIEMVAARELKKMGFKKNFKVQPGMMSAIDTIISHPNIDVKNPSDFFKIAVRREVRAKKVGLYKNKKSPTKEKCSIPFSVKGWESHFPTNPKIIKAIVWERIKEVQAKLGLSTNYTN